MKPKHWSCALLLALAAGCATQSVHWNREDIRPKGVRGDRQLERVQFWSGGSVYRWHWVVVSPDSISGYEEQGRRRALPLSAVDSLQVGYRDGPTSGGSSFGQDLGLIGLILLGLMVP